MTDRVPERSFNRMTWGDFVALLRPHGITVEVLPVLDKSSRGLMVPGYHLVRQDPKPTTTYPLPLITESTPALAWKSSTRYAVILELSHAFRAGL